MNKFTFIYLEFKFNKNDCPAFPNILTYDKLWEILVEDLDKNQYYKIITPYVCVATGHHGTAKRADFPGLTTFPGRILHSVEFKSSVINDLVDKRVLVVGIGNSAVDAAVNLVNEGR